MGNLINKCNVFTNANYNIDYLTINDEEIQKIRITIDIEYLDGNQVSYKIYNNRFIEITERKEEILHKML